MSDQEQQSREVQMEEMGAALYGSAKAGVDRVVGGVSGLFKYSWMGFQYAADDLKQLASKATARIQKQEAAEAEVTA